MWVTGRRQHSERAALAARLATLSRDDIPADVIGLVAAGQKIRAIKRYRELTGASLREAKAVVIDGPDHEHAILLRRTIDDQG